MLNFVDIKHLFILIFNIFLLVFWSKTPIISISKQKLSLYSRTSSQPPQNA